MRKILLRKLTLFFSVFTILVLLFQCSNQKKISHAPNPENVIKTNEGKEGLTIELTFQRGISHNHPLMAVWTETMEGKYIQTLYVAQSIAKGIFNYGDKSQNFWKPGEIRRPAALPYWSHKRGIIEVDGLFVPTAKTPMPDAITAATPKSDFLLISKANETTVSQFRLLFEINQTWDWNEYWTNNKYPDDKEYKTSCQPSVIYSVDIDLNNLKDNYELKPIGHGHYSGKTGELFTDISTLTTALHIAEKITAKVTP